MALTQADILAALRLPDDPDTTQAALIDRLHTAAAGIVSAYTDAAPEAITDEATIRLIGYLYDSPPEDGRAINPLRASGAQAILSPHRVIRTAIVEYAI